MLCEMLGNPFNAMRKSEAAAHIENDSSPVTMPAAGEGEEEIKDDPHGGIFESQAWMQKRSGRAKCVQFRCLVKSERSKVGSLSQIVVLGNLTHGHQVNF